jgi:hypothetical protein
MNIFEKTTAFVDQSFGGKQKAHFERTVYWLETLLPDHTEAHSVAAYSHDIERAFRDENTNAPDDYLDSEFLRHHEERGAEIMKEFLIKEKQSENFIKTVTHLISRHEEGGDREQDVLKDADSVSFFETNAEMFVTKKAPAEGYDKVKAKLDWMFNRISSEDAKAAAQLNYEKWIDELEKYK